MGQKRSFWNLSFLEEKWVSALVLRVFACCWCRFTALCYDGEVSVCDRDIQRVDESKLSLGFRSDSQRRVSVPLAGHPAPHLHRQQSGLFAQGSTLTLDQSFCCVEDRNVMAKFCSHGPAEPHG